MTPAGSAWNKTAVFIGSCCGSPLPRPKGAKKPAQFFKTWPHAYATAPRSTMAKPRRFNLPHPSGCPPAAPSERLNDLTNRRRALVGSDSRMRLPCCCRGRHRRSRSATVLHARAASDGSPVLLCIMAGILFTVLRPPTRAAEVTTRVTTDNPPAPASAGNPEGLYHSRLRSPLRRTRPLPPEPIWISPRITKLVSRSDDQTRSAWRTTPSASCRP